MRERLKENLRGAGAGESRYSLSLSVGLARFDPRNPAPLQDLMAEADTAMYEQKKGQSRRAAGRGVSG